MEQSLHASHEAERLATPRPRHATDNLVVEVYEGWYLIPANSVVPWLWHGVSLIQLMEQFRMQSKGNASGLEISVVKSAHIR
jgi:hypothetical protein